MKTKIEYETSEFPDYTLYYFYIRKKIDKEWCWVWDGEIRLTNLYTVPDKLWMHTEEPEVMSKNSVKRRAEWHNQVVAYYIQEM